MLAICTLLAMGGAVLAQDRALGVVTKVDAAARQIVLKTDAGAEVTVPLQPAASFRRVAPGETDLRNATAIALTDITQGSCPFARMVGRTCGSA